MSPTPAMGDPVFEGVYGPFSITAQDRREVLGYRLALLTAAIAQAALLAQWHWIGPDALWTWLLPLAAGLGLALRWIHIYLRPLHRALQLFWLVGCLGFAALAWASGPGAMAPSLAANGRWSWAIGPVFAALVGSGVKEGVKLKSGVNEGVKLNQGGQLFVRSTHLHAISRNQSHSVTLSGTQWHSVALSGTQWHSVALSRNQWHSPAGVGG